MDGVLVTDLAVDLGLPVIVVCRPGPGTMNHTRLTLEAAWARGIAVLGLVLTAYPPEPDLAVHADLEGVQAMAPVLAVVPRLDGRGHGDLPRIRW